MRTAFEWFEGLGKDDRIVSQVVQKYLDERTPVKWAYALLRPPPPPTT